MFVIADIEWITYENGLKSPTQLSAVKVDTNWNEEEKFFSFIHPKETTNQDWSHIAYTGGQQFDYLQAPTAYVVFNNFRSWLDNNDIILWWHRGSEVLYKVFIEKLLKKTVTQKMVSIKDYVISYLECKPFTGSSSYDIARQKGIDIRNKLKHCAENDVRVLRELMSKIEYPQKELLEPLKIGNSVWKMDNLPYQYDASSNTLHKRNCRLITGIRTIGYATINTPIKRGYSSCVCCRDEYQKAIYARNQKIIEESNYTYIYTPSSNKYHRYNCHLMWYVKSIAGTRTYEAILKTKKCPCKICNPSPNDVYNLISAKNKETRIIKKAENSLPREQLKAIKRQKIAAKERDIALKRTDISDQEKNDIYTLTQPRFAFWASQGYQNFHLHACPKLHTLSKLIGFSTYNEAVHAGYSPCKKCKPTSKHNINISVPITSKIRSDERLSDLEQLCADTGYEYKSERNYFYIVTSVGKWRIDISTAPITLSHINLIVTPDCCEYHVQPRLFLSFIDAFEYIKRHDDELAKKAK